MSFIGSQAVDHQFPGPTIVKLLGVLSELATQAAHGAGVDVDQACRAFERTTLPQMLGDGLRFRNLAVSQRRAFTLAELVLADAAPQVADALNTVHLVNGQVALPCLPE